MHVKKKSQLLRLKKTKTFNFKKQLDFKEKYKNTSILGF